MRSHDPRFIRIGGTDVDYTNTRPSAGRDDAHNERTACRCQSDTFHAIERQADNGSPRHVDQAADPPGQLVRSAAKPVRLQLLWRVLRHQPTVRHLQLPPLYQQLLERHRLRHPVPGRHVRQVGRPPRIVLLPWWQPATALQAIAPVAAEVGADMAHRAVTTIAASRYAKLPRSAANGTRISRTCQHEDTLRNPSTGRGSPLVSGLLRSGSRAGVAVLLGGTTLTLPASGVADIIPGVVSDTLINWRPELRGREAVRATVYEVEEG